MKSGDLLKIALVGVGGYVLYQYLVSTGQWAQWFGGAAATTPASLPSGTTSTQTTTSLAPVPRMTVTTASGNTAQMKVGDAWSVSITGAAPNVPVDVTAVQQGGQTYPHATGGTVTDVNGNFTSSGLAEAGHVGTWTESWTVNGVPVGNWNFTISPAASVAGVGAIVDVPNSGPITSPLPSMSFRGGGYNQGKGGQRKTWVQ